MDRNLKVLQAPSMSRMAADSDQQPKHKSDGFDLLGSLKRHKVVSILLASAITVTGLMLIQLKFKPAYETSTTIYIAPNYPKMLQSDEEVTHQYDSYAENQVHNITRADIVKEAIESLPYWVRHGSGPATEGEIVQLANSVSAHRVGLTYQVEISITGQQPQGLAEKVNALTEKYVEKMHSEEFYDLDKRLNTLQSEGNKLHEQIASKLNEQSNLLQELGVTNAASKDSSQNVYNSTLTLLGSVSITAPAAGSRRSTIGSS